MNSSFRSRAASLAPLLLSAFGAAMLPAPVSAADPVPLSLNFAAEIAGQPFACGQRYANLGRTDAEIARAKEESDAAVAAAAAELEDINGQVADAKAEAEDIIAKAREEAQRVIEASQSEAAEIGTTAQAEAQRISEDAEASARERVERIVADGRAQITRLVEAEKLARDRLFSTRAVLQGVLADSELESIPEIQDLHLDD